MDKKMYDTNTVVRINIYIVEAIYELFVEFIKRDYKGLRTNRLDKRFLADMMHTSPEIISSGKTGKRKPTEKMIRDLAKECKELSQALKGEYIIVISGIKYEWAEEELKKRSQEALKDFRDKCRQSVKNVYEIMKKDRHYYENGAEDADKIIVWMFRAIEEKAKYINDGYTNDVVYATKALDKIDFEVLNECGFTELDKFTKRINTLYKLTNDVHRYKKLKREAESK